MKTGRQSSANRIRWLSGLDWLLRRHRPIHRAISHCRGPGSVAFCATVWRARLTDLNEPFLRLAAANRWPMVVGERSPPAEWRLRAATLGVPWVRWDDPAAAQIRPDLLIVFSGKYAWQENIQERSRSILHIETGPLPKTLIVDWGQCGESAWISDLSRILDGIVPDRGWITQAAAKGESKYEQPSGVPPLPDRFIFVPLQSGNDVQITLHAPFTNRGFVAEVARVFTESALPVVFKLHPRDNQRQHTERLLKGVIDNRQFFVVDGPVDLLCRRAAVVVTQNSSVAIDAFFQGTAVIHCGDALYQSCGATIHNHDLTAGFQTFQSLTDSERAAMRDRQQRFLTWLRDVYCIPWTGDIGAFVARIGAQIEMERLRTPATATPNSRR
jgi:hypothetical protein